MSRCARLPLSGFAGLLHGKACHTILRSLRFLTNRVPLPPLFRGQNKTPRNTLFISISTISTGCCAPSKRGKGGGASHQRGMHFQRPQGGCKGFIIRGRLLSIKRRPPRQRSDTIYLPRARALNPPVRRSRSQAEPLAPRARGPAAPSTLAAKPRQPSGILESTAQVPKSGFKPSGILFLCESSIPSAARLPFLRSCPHCRFR